MMRGSKVLSWVVLAALALGIVLMLGLVMYRQGLSAHEREMQQTEIAALQSGLAEANARLAERGEPTVDVPPVESRGDPVPPTIILGEPGTDGQDGKPGKPGADGEDGADGEPGRDGIDGEPGADGADGLPGADGADGIDGAAGADGKPGTNGKDGRGIAAIECHTTGDWIITLTDGTALTVEGPCRVVQPTPTPTASTTKGR